jgi:heat shock protein HtpX
MFGNWLKTTLLMAAIMALFGIVGAALGGGQGMLLALAIGGVMNFWAYWYSDRVVLSMYKAREVDAASAPQLYGIVRDLAQKAGLPMPRVYVIDEEQPNAFATGRNPEHAAVACTTGIMRILTERELRGVMAHELTHVKHRDTLISTVTAIAAGAVSAIAHFGVFFGGRDDQGNAVNPVVALLIMLLAPFAAMLIQLAISRAREFEADRGGAQMSADPLALASALEKMERYAAGVALPTAQAHPETAQMMIVNPLSSGGLAGLFSTHPATEERVQRLREMQRQPQAIDS